MRSAHLRLVTGFFACAYRGMRFAKMHPIGDARPISSIFVVPGCHLHSLTT